MKCTSTESLSFLSGRRVHKYGDRHDEVNQDHPARWRTEWVGLKHSADPQAYGVHAAQFSKTAAPSTAGLAALNARRTPQRGFPRRTGEYSAASDVCLVPRAKASSRARIGSSRAVDQAGEAALSRLQDLIGEDGGVKREQRWIDLLDRKSVV